MSIFKNLTDEEIDEFVNDFMHVNFGDEWEDNPGFSLICPIDSKLCPKCQSKLDKKKSTSFNGDTFDVFKCTNSQCGYCE
jgi:hypothetical protein